MQGGRRICGALYTFTEILLVPQNEVASLQIRNFLIWSFPARHAIYASAAVERQVEL